MKWTGIALMTLFITFGASAQSMDPDDVQETEIAFQLEVIEGTWFWKQNDEDHITIRFEESGKSFKGYPLIDVGFFDGWKLKMRKRFSFDVQESAWCEGSLDQDCSTHFRMLKDPGGDYAFLVFRWEGTNMDDYTYRSLPKPEQD